VYMFTDLTVTNLKKSFGKSTNRKEVLKGINLTVKKGECLGIVGESGCGKTTLACCIVGLLSFDVGDITIKTYSQEGETNHIFTQLSNNDKNKILRTYVQYIFQNPGGSLHPKKRISNTFKESVRDINRLTNRKLVCNLSSLLKVISIEEKMLDKYPLSFSGGEKQRLAIARALLVQPSLLVADEPLSNMDVTTQARILNYFRQMNQEGLTSIFITHDLSSAHFLCNTIAIMKDGVVVEKQSADEIFLNPIDNYTKELIAMNKSINNED
jgi:ABC-type dipeptide/oligopeptide/nickel transport system ATPase subunit